MTTLFTTLFAVFDWRSHAVLKRNATVYLRNWRTAFFPPAMEPVIYFLAFGLGLGGYVGYIKYHHESVSYATWVAPGLLAYTAFSTPFFEALYAAYVRMFYQKTWDGILATQVELHHIVWGEILWAGFRGMMNTAIVALVLAIFCILGKITIAWPFLWVAPLLAGLIGCVFAAFALIFTALVPSIDHMNYPVFLLGVPIGLISNTYFPITSEHPWIRGLVAINPVHYLAESLRAILVGGPIGAPLTGLLLTGVIYLTVMVLLAERLLQKRVLGD